MTDRPTKPHEWANGANPNLATDVQVSAFRALGYPEGFPPPGSAHNWQFDMLSKWLDFLDKSGGRYSSLEAAVAALAVNDTGIVQSVDWGGAGNVDLGEDADLVFGAGAGHWIHSDGEYVVVCAGHPYLYSRDFGTEVREYVPAGGLIVATKAVSNGKYVAAIGTGNALEVWDRDTGVSVFTHDFQGEIHDVAMNGKHVAIVGERNATNTSSLRIFDLFPVPGLVTDYDHNATLYSVACFSDQFYAAGDAGGTGGVIQVLQIGLDGTPLWETDPSLPIVTAPRALVSTRRYLIAHNGGTALMRFERYTGDELDARTGINVDTPHRLSADHRFLYLCETGGENIYQIDPSTLSICRTLRLGGATVSSSTSDGDRLFVMAGGGVCSRRTLGYGPETWVKTGYSQNMLVPQVILPAGF